MTPGTVVGSQRSLFKLTKTDSFDAFHLRIKAPILQGSDLAMYSLEFSGFLTAFERKVLYNEKIYDR